MSYSTLQVRRGISIEWISLFWTLIEAGVAVSTGLLAHSLSLVAFGADSIIEMVAGIVLLWRLYVEASGFGIHRVKRAETISSWIVGISLLSLGIYILVAAFNKLQSHTGAETSPVGISLAVLSGFIMPVLARTKMTIGDQIGSRALKADGACSIVCAYMAWTVVAGGLLTTFWGWWWADSIASLWLVYFVVNEGIEVIQKAQGAEDICCD